jgi:hypothetical protein
MIIKLIIYYWSINVKNISLVKQDKMKMMYESDYFELPLE